MPTRTALRHEAIARAEKRGHDILEQRWAAEEAKQEERYGIQS